MQILKLPGFVSRIFRWARPIQRMTQKHQTVNGHLYMTMPL